MQNPRFKSNEHLLTICTMYTVRRETWCDLKSLSLDIHLIVTDISLVLFNIASKYLFVYL
jgi:hypothetical protein